MLRIVVSNNIQDLSGEGEEYLLDKEGEPIAHFYNGMILGSEFEKADDGPTLSKAS